MRHTARVPKELCGWDSGSEGGKRSMQRDPGHSEAPATAITGGRRQQEEFGPGEL